MLTDWGHLLLAEAHSAVPTGDWRRDELQGSGGASRRGWGRGWGREGGGGGLGSWLQVGSHGALGAVRRGMRVCACVSVCVCMCDS